MAITRRIQRMNNGQNGRRLRSGAVVLTTEHRVHTKRTSSSPKQNSGQPEISGRSHQKQEEEAAKLVRPADDVQPTSLNQRAMDGRPDFSQLMVVDDSAPGNPTLASIPPESSERQIGVPQDGQWEVIEALNRRFCSKHGGHEWLLQVADAWLQPDDFKIPDALHKLETSKESDTDKDVKAGSKVHCAECNSRLWSQVDRVTGEDLVNGNRYFRVQWKPHWFQEKDVDLAWAKTSLENRPPLGRRSGRNDHVEAGLTDGQRAILAVLAIE